MELIIFFTNKIKLGAVNIIFPHELSSQNTNSYYEYCFQNDKVILVINDMIDENSLVSILSKYNKITKLYYVHHSLPSAEIKLKIKALCAEQNIPLIPQNDIHDFRKSKFYNLVGNFSSPGSVLNIDFFEGLKSKFNYDEVLEKKLILLHDCLHYESAATTDTSWLNEDQKKIVTYLASQKDNLDKDYIEALTELRKTLLGS